jgi:hypothetical protein
VLSESGDQVVETAEGGRDTVKQALTAAGTYIMAAKVEYADIITGAAIDVTGNDLDKVINGNAAANRLIGGVGGDGLYGGADAGQLPGLSRHRRRVCSLEKSASDRGFLPKVLYENFSEFSGFQAC